MTSIMIDRTDGLSSAAAIKGPVVAATTANITLYGEQTIDGVAVVTGDRVLVKDQTAGYENGIYICDTGQWRRSKDFNRTNDVVKGTMVFVNEGTISAETMWAVTSDNPVVVGTDTITFSNDVLIPPNNSVGTAQIQDEAVTPSKLDSDGDFQTLGFTAWTNGEYRTLRERATDTYCILDAPGSPDPTGANNSNTAFADMVSQGVKCEVTAGTWLLTQKLIIPDGITIEGQGRGYEFGHKTKLLFAGAGTKEYAISGATATSVANPDAGAAYLADSGTRGNTYSTLDLTSNFSAAIILGKASGLKGLGIYPNFNGVTGYAGTTGDLSDEWDVGVWARNSDWWNIEDCNVIGHWRKSALLVSAHDIGDGNIPSNEIGHAVRSTFQGFRGISIRSPETVVGDNWGFAGTDFINCLVRGLNHKSAHLATSSFLTTPFSSPSAALEISGDVMRGVQFLNSTFLHRDDISMFFGKCSEIQFDGCYEESKDVKVSGAWLSNSLGSRMVATADTIDVTWQGNSQYGIDFTPKQSRDGSLSGQRYSASAGVFSPSTHMDDDYTRRVFSSYIGHRLRANTDRFLVENAAGNDVAFAVNDSGQVVGKLFDSGTITIADDAAGSIPTPKNGGFCFITFTGGTEDSAFPDPLRSGLVFYDAGAASFSVTKLAGGANFIAVNTDVSGTTGTDGNVTIGVIAGNLRIENRQGASSPFRYTFLG